MALSAAVEPITAILRLLGYSPDAEDEEPGDAAAHPSPRRAYKVTVADLLTAVDLTAGEQVTPTRPTWPASGHVDADGSVVVDGRSFSSPSAAASHVRDGRSPNGRSFWAVERDESMVPLATIRTGYLKRQTHQTTQKKP